MFSTQFEKEKKLVDLIRIKQVKRSWINLLHFTLLSDNQFLINLDYWKMCWEGDGDSPPAILGKHIKSVESSRRFSFWYCGQIRRNVTDTCPFHILGFLSFLILRGAPRRANYPVCMLCTKKHKIEAKLWPCYDLGTKFPSVYHDIAHVINPELITNRTIFHSLHLIE